MYRQTVINIGYKQFKKSMNINQIQKKGALDTGALDTLGWYDGSNDPYDTKLVATKRPNALGLYDMMR